MKTSLRLLIAILITAAPVLLTTWNGSSAQNNQQESRGKGQEKFRKSAKPIRDQYIVVFNSETSADEVQPLANELLAKHGGNARHIYKHTIKGFSIKLPEAAAMALSRDPRVNYVQEDSEVTINKTVTTTNWNLDRIDQRDNDRDGTFYFPNVGNGAGIHAYILDTGLRAIHREFLTNGVNRASADADFVWWSNNGDDCNGHGTAVAALLGGNTFGVARAVRLHGVRVLKCDGGGETSDVIEGVDWVTANHVKPAVVNMSLGGGASSSTTALEEAIRYSIANGITYVVAAGNDEIDAQTTIPARIPEVITVGATNNDDQMAWFSNFGSRVDLFAPGQDVRSASIVDTNGDGIFNDATGLIQGTSFAAPLVSGVVARFLNIVPNAAPAAVQGAVISSTTLDVLTELGEGSPNRMLFTDLRHAFLGQQIRTVSESAWEVDSGVDLGPGQWLAMTGSGVIYSGQLTWFPNGPQGWTFPADSSNFPVPSAHPYSLIGQLWGGEGFYIGVSNALVQDVATPKRLLLRINDIMPGDGAGAFTCKTEFWKELPEARANFDSQAVATSLLPGQMAFARITMKNVGPTTWTAGQNFKLALEGGGTTWGRNEVTLPHDVEPEGLVDFIFDFTAPLVSGTYNFQWRMMQEGQRFGDASTNVPITVLTWNNDAQFISQDVPGMMYATESYPVSITMKNVGTTTWPAGSVYRLGAQNPHDNTTWGMNRVQLYQTVYPNQQVTFTFEVMAPVTTGKKNFQWRMVKEGVEWFGATTPNVEVTVKPHPCPSC